jgi:hypothetical protein
MQADVLNIDFCPHPRDGEHPFRTGVPTEERLFCFQWSGGLSARRIVGGLKARRSTS